MSHHTLQKVLVRMLFDEGLVAAVRTDADRALAGFDLTAGERAQLLAVDGRAWRYDPLRRRRTLRTLVEEYKVSTTIVLAETRRLAALEGFFASAFFHRAVQERGSLGSAFADFLLAGHKRSAWTAPQLPDVIRLEAAVVGCRRTLQREGAHEAYTLPATISDRTRVKLAPGCAVGSFQANVIETIQHVERYLFELSLMPAMALCEDAPRLEGLPAVAPQEKIYLLFSPGATGISLTTLDQAAFLVLHAAQRPIAINGLSARPEAAQTQAVVAEWLAQGVLEPYVGQVSWLG